jgi:hypothetical protein
MKSGTEGGSSLPDLNEAISAARVRRGDKWFRHIEIIFMMILPFGREGTWSVAGNGGKMAEVQQESIRDKSRGKKSGRTKKAAPAKASREKTAVVDGIELLRQAADRQIGRSPTKFADVLSTRAKAGDVPSLRVLVMLAERKKPRAEPVKKPRRRSQALELALEPEWQGPEEGEEIDDRD